MLERETWIEELWKRIAEVDGVKFTDRNPKDPPAIGNLPAILLFERSDMIEKRSMRGAYPIHSRLMQVALEAFVLGTSEASVKKELAIFAKAVKKSVFRDNNLGGTCSEFRETETGPVLRPKMGPPVAGVTMFFEVRYVENVALLFV